MPICFPNLPNNDRLVQEVASSSFRRPGSVYGKKLCLSHPDAIDTIPTSSWKGGVLSLYVPWRVGSEQTVRQSIIASISFTDFTYNCGIRAITCNSIGNSEVGKQWFEIFEAYAYAHGYSVLVGSTGQQNGKAQLDYVQQYGVDWQVVSPGLNRRITSMEDNLSLYWKYLKEPQIQINWNQEISDAEQITTS